MYSTWQPGKTKGKAQGPLSSLFFLGDFENERKKSKGERMKDAQSLCAVMVLNFLNVCPYSL